MLEFKILIGVMTWTLFTLPWVELDQDRASKTKLNGDQASKKTSLLRDAVETEHPAFMTFFSMGSKYLLGTDVPLDCVPTFNRLSNVESFPMIHIMPGFY
jgi:hypothetical protein